jgi:hypothetical protein
MPNSVALLAWIRTEKGSEGDVRTWMDGEGKLIRTSFFVPGVSVSSSLSKHHLYMQQHYWHFVSPNASSSPGQTKKHGYRNIVSSHCFSTFFSTGKP